EPFGPCAARGRVHVEPTAQRAVIEVTVTGRLVARRSVQPLPLPRPSATVTGTWTGPFAVAFVAADFATSFPGVKVSLTTIVPAPAGPAVRRAIARPRRERRNTRPYSFRDAIPRPVPACDRSVPHSG